MGHVGSKSLARDRTLYPAWGAWSLGHWTTREVPEGHTLDMPPTLDWQDPPHLPCNHTDLPVSAPVIFQLVVSSTDCELLENGLLGVTLSPTFVPDFVGL